eukprot:scaffold10808_cov75-Phaeocystis_antarctica.AAC.4
MPPPSPEHKRSSSCCQLPRVPPPARAPPLLGVGHECPKVQGSIASPLGRPGPRLGQCSPFLRPLVRPR